MNLRPEDGIKLEAFTRHTTDPIAQRAEAIDLAEAMALMLDRVLTSLLEGPIPPAVLADVRTVEARWSRRSWR